MNMKLFTTLLSLFALSYIISCDLYDPSIEVGVTDTTSGETVFTPIAEEDLPVIPEDIVRDVIRAIETETQFQYDTLAEIELDIEVVSDENAGVQAVISIVDSAGNLIYRGVTDPDGVLTDSFITTLSSGEAVLIISVGGEETRSIVINNLSELLKLDRTFYTPIPLNFFNDSDFDGVPNNLDHFSDDPNLAFAINYPPNDMYTVAFEDLYPKLGDYDMNDWVVSYWFTEYRNAANQVVSITGEAQAIARGAGYNHNFYLGIPGVNGATITVNYLNHEGTMIGGATLNQSGNRIDIPVFLSTKNSFDQRTPAFENVFPNEPFEPGYVTQFRVDLTQPQASNELAAAPYDPYIEVINTNQEVHLPYAEGLAAGETYLDQNGFPWAILVPSTWATPLETHSIVDAYPAFSNWVASAGSDFTNWYNNPDPNHVFGE